MKPKQAMDYSSIEGNPMAVRIYPTGGRVLAVRGTSGGTNIPDQSSDCPDLSVYLRDDLSICVAAVSLRTGVRWHSMFIRVQLKDGCAVAEMHEPFVHPRYPTTFDGWRVCVQVAGEWYATTTLNLVGRVVTAENICKLLAGTITEEDFIASAEGESLTDKVVRLERELADASAQLAQAQEWATQATRARDTLVNLFNRLAVEVGMPHSSDRVRRTVSECLGVGDVGCVIPEVFEQWISWLKERSQGLSRALEQVSGLVRMYEVSVPRGNEAEMQVLIACLGDKMSEMDADINAARRDTRSAERKLYNRSSRWLSRVETVRSGLETEIGRLTENRPRAWFHRTTVAELRRLEEILAEESSK